MSEYIQYKRTPSEIRHMSEVMIQQDYKFCVESTVANLEAHNKKLAAYRDILERAKIVWGLRSAEYKYLYRAKIPKPPDLMRTYQKVRAAFDKEQTARIQREKRRDYTRDYRQRQEDAVDWLVNNGYKLGEDFLKSHAISFYNQKQNEEAVKTFEERFGV